MSNNSINYIFKLCKHRLYGSYGLYDDLKGIVFDFDSIKKIMIENNLSAFLYKPIKEYNDKNHFLNDEIIADYGRNVQAIMFRELKQNHAIRTIVDEAKKGGLQLVFFKGIVLADLYPQYAERISSDSDILVSDADRPATESLLVQLGYEKDEEESKNMVQVYYNKDFEHMVELHTRLWEDYEGPRIETLKRMRLSCSETNIKTKACGIEIETLGYEKHLVYQLFHIIKHFSLNGIGIRYLIDITLFVNKYFDKIDWKLFWKHMDELGYTKFIESFFRICIAELLMTDKVFDTHEASFDCSVEDLKMDLLKVGNINDKEAGWQIMGAMEAYFTGEVEAPKTKFRRQLSMMFPSAKAMPKTYTYVRKYPILLPLAWIHRDIKYLIRKNAQKNDGYNISEKIDVAEKRLHLIEELGLAER